MGQDPGSSQGSGLTGPISRSVVDHDDHVIMLDQLADDGRNDRRLVVGGNDHHDRLFRFTWHRSQQYTAAVSNKRGRSLTKPILRTKRSVFGSAYKRGRDLPAATMPRPGGLELAMSAKPHAARASDAARPGLDLAHDAAHCIEEVHRYPHAAAGSPAGMPHTKHPARLESDER